MGGWLPREETSGRIQSICQFILSSRFTLVGIVSFGESDCGARGGRPGVNLSLSPMTWVFLALSLSLKVWGNYSHFT